MTDFEPAIQRNVEKSKAAEKAMMKAIEGMDVAEAHKQMKTMKSARATVRRLRGRQEKNMSLADGISKVLDTMRAGEQMPLHTFIKHVEVTRHQLDDGAVPARLMGEVGKGDAPFRLSTVADEQGRRRQVIIKK